MDISDDLNISDEEQVITPGILVDKLRQAWRNEKLSPDILQHESEIVDSVFAQIGAMESNIENLNKTDFCFFFHQSELERIRYILSSYLRTRLDKIQRFAWFFLDQEENLLKEKQEGRLSPAELKFLKEYTTGIEEHMNLVGLRFMPSSFQQLDKTKMLMSSPNMNAHVFCRTLPGKSVRGLIINAENPDREAEVDLEADTQHIIQYRYVANYVRSGYIDLI